MLAYRTSWYREGGLAARPAWIRAKELPGSLQVFPNRRGTNVWLGGRCDRKASSWPSQRYANNLPDYDAAFARGDEKSIADFDPWCDTREVETKVLEQQFKRLLRQATSTCGQSRVSLFGQLLVG